MNLSVIHENPFILLTWVTTIGLFISLIEATIKIKSENYINLKRREEMIRKLYP